jgi:hypothetical protein
LRHITTPYITISVVAIAKFFGVVASTLIFHHTLWPRNPFSIPMFQSHYNNNGSNKNLSKNNVLGGDFEISLRGWHCASVPQCLEGNYNNGYFFVHRALIIVSSYALACEATQHTTTFGS